MNGPGFFHHLNFRHAASKCHLEAHETDMVLSNEILAASRTNEKAIFAQLRTSREGLDPAEAQARLASAGPNLVTKEGIVGTGQESLERLASFSRGSLLLHRRHPRGDRHRGAGFGTGVIVHAGAKTYFG
jgi:hypothetical protein